MTDDLNPSGADDIDVAMVLAAHAAFAKGDIDAAVANLHPDVEWIEPDEFPNGGRHVGPAAVANYLRQSHDVFTVEDGLVTHLQAYADPADAIQTG
jgi:ketosteroid isomerase-like protein